MTSFALAYFVDSAQWFVHFHARDEEVSTVVLPGNRYYLDFPIWESRNYPVTDLVRCALNGHEPEYAGQNRDLVRIVDVPPYLSAGRTKRLLSPCPSLDGTASNSSRNRLRCRLPDILPPNIAILEDPVFWLRSVPSSLVGKASGND